MNNEEKVALGNTEMTIDELKLIEIVQYWFDTKTNLAVNVNSVTSLYGSVKIVTTQGDV